MAAKHVSRAGGMILTGENQWIRENPTPVPFIHHTPHMDRLNSELGCFLGRGRGKMC
jgi:hypothetical protein